MINTNAYVSEFKYAAKVADELIKYKIIYQNEPNKKIKNLASTP